MIRGDEPDRTPLDYSFHRQLVAGFDCRDDVGSADVERPAGFVPANACWATVGLCEEMALHAHSSNTAAVSHGLAARTCLFVMSGKNQFDHFQREIADRRR